jgi:short-subunit dehydrogenase
VETVEADLTSPADLRLVEDILRTNANISVLVNSPSELRRYVCRSWAREPFV